MLCDLDSQKLTIPSHTVALFQQEHLSFPGKKLSIDDENGVKKLMRFDNVNKFSKFLDALTF